MIAPIMDFPALTKIRQRFKADSLPDVPAELRKRLDAAGVDVPPGLPVAVAVGSRGITALPEIVKEVVAWLESRGAQPFIVPAMGSHGAATAQGQKEILEAYGVTEASTGAKIVSDMAVVELPRGDSPVKVYFDRNAYRARATIAVNRVKPHSDYHGPYESGLMKMLAIGLGKHAQAAAIHSYGVAGLRDIMPQVARRILDCANVIMGVAIVENACHETMLVEAIPAAKIPEREPHLLEVARANMPSLPVDDLDILIVDEIGKEISGVGMDTNIIGRMMIRGEPEPDRPSIKIIIARDLTAASHGNALGVGLADIITRRLFEKIDFDATYANVKTSTFLERAKIPVIADDDSEAAEFAMRTVGPTALDDLKIIRILNTMKLEEIYASPAVLRLLAGDPAIEVTGPALEPFGPKGEFFPFRS